MGLLAFRCCFASRFFTEADDWSYRLGATLLGAPWLVIGGTLLLRHRLGRAAGLLIVAALAAYVLAVARDPALSASLGFYAALCLPVLAVALLLASGEAGRT